MSRDEVDRAIVGLVAAYDRISAAMYELDGRAGLTVLRGGDLTGTTRDAATRVLAGTDQLWSYFAALGNHLEAAKAVRGERSRPGEDELRELTVLLRGPVVGVDADGLALDPTATGPAAQRLTLWDVARDLEGRAAEVHKELAGVESACSRIAADWEPLSAAVGRVRASAAALDPDAVPAAEALAARLAEAHGELLRDPLGRAGVADPRAAAIAADVRALEDRLAALAALREGYPERAARLTAAVDEVAEAEERAGEACALVLVKIANPGLPAVPGAAGSLRGHLAQLDQMHRDRRWSGLDRELAAAERATTEALRRAREVREAADGLMERRAELRGRLDAFRARATRLGVVEDPELSARHRAAHDLLYTSPCDLPAATRAVVAYQRHLNQLTERSAPKVTGRNAAQAPGLSASDGREAPA